MNGVKEHYENHLAHFYAWMCGDFDQARSQFQRMLESNRILPASTRLAVDLGSGHGIQSVAIKNVGFDVLAIDFSETLLEQLRSKDDTRSIRTVNADIRHFRKYLEAKPELIVCCGDTLTHLENADQVNQLIRDCSEALTENGHLILSYRDYSVDVSGERKFIPVKSDKKKILTCMLDLEAGHVTVTDLLHENKGDSWMLKVSSYKKLRIDPLQLNEEIKKNRLAITLHEVVGGMVFVMARKNF